MNRDDRLDDILRAVLADEAAGAARFAPPVDEAVRTLAQRQRSERPATLRPVTVLLVAALLLATLVATIVLGSRLLPAPRAEERPSYGIPGECLRTETYDGLVVAHASQRDLFLVYEDGRLLHISGDRPRDVLLASVRAVITERRLTDRGISLLLDAVEATGLTSGCRRLYSPSVEGSLWAKTQSGVLEAHWSDGASLTMRRVASADEERALADVAERLANPERWLPAEAWVDPVPRPTEPAEWFVITWVADPDHRAGPLVSLAGQRVEIPAGLSPETASGPGTSIRLANDQTFELPACGTLGSDEAAELIEAVNRAGLASDVWYVSIDEAEALPVGVHIGAVLPGAAPQCEWTARLQQSPAWASPVMAAPQRGEYSDVSPCDFLPVDAARELLRADQIRIGDSNPTPFARHTRTCHYWTDGTSPAAALTFSPDRIAEVDDVRPLAELVFGAGIEERSVAGGLVWLNGCWDGPPSCQPAMAVWKAPYFVVVSWDLLGGQTGFEPPANASVDELARAILASRLP